jgi:LysM repeat protein
VRFRRPLYGYIIVILMLLHQAGSGILLAFKPEAAQAANVSAFDLILAMNTLRMSYGLPALVEDPIINAVAQATAETMAANEMSWHIGNVSGRLASAGYGGGAKVWATENFAVGDHSIDEIMVIWSDASHMIPAVNPAYCNVGAGVARSANGRTYYVLQAAYTASHACGEYKPPAGLPPQGGSNSNSSASIGGVSQLIVPVKKATPDAEGRIFHVVEAGQSFWAIAVAYNITIKELETWNNLTKDAVLKVGQRLFIPGSNTQGYSTPTPVGMVLVNEPGADGKIIHVVQPYQTLITIAQAYKVSMDRILSLNGIQEDWPLQIDQELVISLENDTAGPTPGPLSPIEQLTPASDGRYYHTVKGGETLSWIAGLYEVTLQDLMAWNGLNGESVIYPDQRLVLLVTPPATATAMPSPTGTSQVAINPPSSISADLASPPTPTLIKEDTRTTSRVSPGVLFLTLTIGMALSGFILIVYSIRKKE